MLQITIELAAPPTEAVQIPFFTKDGSARGGEDFVQTTGTVTIPAGQMRASISIPIIADTLSEQPEFFYVNLGQTGTIPFSTSQVHVTLLDPDARLLFLPVVGQ